MGEAQGAQASGGRCRRQLSSIVWRTHPPACLADSFAYSLYWQALTTTTTSTKLVCLHRGAGSDRRAWGFSAASSSLLFVGVGGCWGRMRLRYRTDLSICRSAEPRPMYVCSARARRWVGRSFTYSVFMFFVQPTLFKTYMYTYLLAYFLSQKQCRQHPSPKSRYFCTCMVVAPLTRDSTYVAYY